jgi:hypothetical protein
VSRILVVCEDAGGARALVPVLHILARRGEALEAWAVGAARTIFAAEAPPLDAAGEEAVAGADLVLTSSTCWGERVEARAVCAARRAGRPSLTVLDFWARYRERLSWPGADDLGALPDRLAVIDPTMEADARAAGVPGDVIVVTGSPAFDSWTSHPLPPPPAGPRRVLFVSQPIEALWGTTLGYTETGVLRATVELARERDATVAVRAHPREDAAALSRFVVDLGPGATMDDAPNLRDAMQRASVVVCLTAIALV